MTKHQEGFRFKEQVIHFIIDDKDQGEEMSLDIGFENSWSVRVATG